MKAAELINALQGDSLKRLKWLVLKETGISPVSLKAAMLTPRKTMEIACHMALDRREKVGKSGDGDNPSFDMGRFTALEGGGKL